LAYCFKVAVHGCLALCDWDEHLCDRSKWRRSIFSSWQRENGEKDRMGSGIRYCPGHTPSNLLSQATSHLLKFPEPPKVAQPDEDQSFNMSLLGDTLYPNHNILLLTP
jgi:hypothetical protein